MKEFKLKRAIDKTVHDVLLELDLEDLVRDNMIENGIHPMEIEDETVIYAFNEIYQEVIYHLKHHLTN